MADKSELFDVNIQVEQQFRNFKGENFVLNAKTIQLNIYSLGKI